MDNNILSADEEMDDDAFLASLEELLEKPEKPQEKPAQPPKKDVPPKKKPKISLPVPMLAVKLAVAAVCLLLIVAFASALSYFGGTIPQGVTIGPIAVGGMTRGEAKKALKQEYVFLREDSPLTVSFAKRSTKKLDLSPYQIAFPKKGVGLKLDVTQAVKDAENAAADTLLPITPYLTLDTDAIRTWVSAYAEDLKKYYCDAGWHLEGDAPDVTSPDFDENTPCQTLVMDPGVPAVNISEEALYRQILNAYETNQATISYSGPLDVSSPAMPDLEEISEAVSKAPVEPSLDRDTLKLIPGVPGYTFDAEAVKAKFPGIPFGQTLSIPLHPVFPEMADEEAYFQDVLGHCETPYSNNPPRIVNLELACKALDGLVLEPGQDFSYNETLGERTAEKGYQPAPAYSGTTLVDSLGGGICQVSSTLYLASVYAELTVTERKNHGYPVHYIPYGMDATVNWGFTDLKMRNDSDLPVKIKAEASDGFVRIDILGVETRDYDIKMSYSVGGRHVKTYMSKIDKDTGELLSKDFVALSSYLEDVYPS